MRWTNEEVEFLESRWGTVSMPAIAKSLNRTIYSIINKAQKLGLGNMLEAGDYITFNQLYNAINNKNSNSYENISWIRNRGFPIKRKKVINKSVRIVILSDFWKWAEKNKNMINWANVEKNILGEEPKWVDEHRKADFYSKSFFKKEPWTKSEDEQLASLVHQYKYGYREISLKLQRTEGAIKRRLCDLQIKARPIKAYNHIKWTDDEVKKAIEMYHKGFSFDYMARHINRSVMAIRGKVERELNFYGVRCDV